MACGEGRTMVVLRTSGVMGAQKAGERQKDAITHAPKNQGM